MFNLQFFSVDFPAYGCYTNADDGRQEVEETIGEVGQGGNTQDGALGETAGVPGNEHGGDGAAVLTGAAQQTGFVSHLGIHVFEHGTGEDDGQKLVSGGDVEEKGTSHR